MEAALILCHRLLNLRVEQVLLRPWRRNEQPLKQAVQLDLALRFLG